MKGGVKRGYLWDPWQGLFHRFDAGQADGVVERCQLCEFCDHPLDLWGDLHGGGVPLAAVNDAMSNGLEFAEFAQRCRRASVQVLEDTGDGISVFSQLQLFADFLLAGAAEN
jgi:hypothetical protein